MIEFTTSFGKFLLPIKASLPEHVLEFPSSIDFSYCPIKEIAKQTFVLKNDGELTSSYEWEIPNPFAIYPSSGTLLSGASETVRIEFIPQVCFYLKNSFLNSLECMYFTSNCCLYVW